MRVASWEVPGAGSERVQTGGARALHHPAAARNRSASRYPKCAGACCGTARSRPMCRTGRRPAGRSRGLSSRRLRSRRRLGACARAACEKVGGRQEEEGGRRKDKERQWKVKLKAVKDQEKTVDGQRKTTDGQGAACDTCYQFQWCACGLASPGTPNQHTTSCKAPRHDNYVELGLGEAASPVRARPQPEATSRPGHASGIIA